MNMKYRVGDLVVIKSGLTIGETYDGNNFVFDMTKYEGMTAKIIFASYREGFYLLDVDHQKFSWSDSMLKLKWRSIYKLGEKVRVRSKLEVGEYYGKFRCDEYRPTFCGGIFTVIKVDSDETYQLNCGSDCYWTPEMLKPVDFEEEPIHKEDTIKSGFLAEPQSTLPPSAQKLSKLIGALFYSGVDEFSIQYDHGAIQCSVEIDEV